MPVLSDYDLWKTTPPGWDDLDPPDDDEPQSDDTDNGGSAK